MTVILSTAYWPNLHYFWYLLNAEQVRIEVKDFYEKQTYRNRTTIFSANGPLTLSIPVHRSNSKAITETVLLTSDTPWRQQHWHAIRSAYGKSPFFEYFAEDFAALYEQKQLSTLVEFNMAQLRLILKILRIKKELPLTSQYEEYSIEEDLRQRIHPKLSFTEDGNVKAALQAKYYQTFGARYDFVPNLSILDLLFNMGLDARNYLLQVKD